MAKERFPVTPAVRVLRREKAEFGEHLYAYQERGGTPVAARELGVDERSVVKTLVMEDDQGRPLVVLMHGPLQVSTQRLARAIGVRSVSPCAPERATKHTGYQVGGISPFGTRAAMPVLMEKTILDLPRVYINGGKRGYLLELDPGEIARILQPTVVEVGFLQTDP